MCFKTQKRGDLLVTKEAEQCFSLDFPALPHQLDPSPPKLLIDSLSIPPKKVYAGLDFLLIYENEEQVRNLEVNHSLIKTLDKRGFIVTAPGKTYDCVSRCFYPTLDVIEDPVTGSAHCLIIPYWAPVLKKQKLLAYQASERGGELHCELAGERVFLKGNVVPYLEGILYI